MSLTARDLLRQIANDSDKPYREIAILVNELVKEGAGLMKAVHDVAEKSGLDPSKYTLDAERIASTIRSILQEDYSQTLMISAVLAQMTDSKGNDRFPPPAFFVYLELLSETDQRNQTDKIESSNNIDAIITRIIELLTTLVSVICKWSSEGIVGVADACPNSLKELAKSVSRRTRLLQAGLWICLSCKRTVDISQARSLLCQECDNRIYGGPESAAPNSDHERDRLGYGQSMKQNTIDNDD